VRPRAHCVSSIAFQVHAVSEADKRTPWHEAAAAGHAHILEQLVEVSEEEGVLSSFIDPTNNSVLNQVDDQGQTPLMLACKGKSDQG
jgi:ankyrin repeat protein